MKISRCHKHTRIKCIVGTSSMLNESKNAGNRQKDVDKADQQLTLIFFSNYVL